MSKTKLDCLKLINSIENSPEFKKQISSSKKILIAYSGGQDSSSLLAIFYILSKKWKFQLGVVYCNHGWNQSTQATLSAFKVLQHYKLPFYFIDIAPELIQKSENKARQWRYTAFEEVMQYGKYDLLLTGHTLSDKTETLLFNLCRGTGLKGACSLKTFKTFNKNFQNQTYKFTYQTMNLQDFVVNNSLNNSLENFFVQTNFRNKTNLYELFSFNCYLKKIKIMEIVPLVALPFFSPSLKTKIKHWQLNHLTTLCNFALNYFKYTINNRIGFNSLTNKFNFVSQTMIPPKIQKRNFIGDGTFLVNTYKKQNLNLKINLYFPVQLKKSYINCILAHKALKTNYPIKVLYTPKKASSLITFFSPATYISARRFLFNFLISQNNCSFNKNQKNSLKNSISLQSFVSFITPSNLFDYEQFASVFNYKKTPFIFKTNCIDPKFFWKQKSPLALQLFKNKQLNKGNKNFCTTYKPKNYRFFFLKKTYWWHIVPITKPTIFFNVTHSFYEFLFFNTKFNLLLKKKTKEKINVNFFYFSNKIIQPAEITFNNYFILSYTDFFKNNSNLSSFIEYRCFFISQNKSKEFAFLIKSIFALNFKDKKKYYLLLLNFPIILFSRFISLNKQPDFLFLKQNLALEKNIEVKYFVRKIIISPFLLNKFYKKQGLNNNQYCLNFKLRIVRPLLNIDRPTLFLFIIQLNLPVYFDQTNNQINITRNFIRKKIIPLLKEVNPKAEQNFYKFSQIANLYYVKVGHIQCPGDLAEPFKP